MDVVPGKQQKRQKMGEILVQAGLLDHTALEKALQLQKASKKRLGEIILEMGLATDVQLAELLAKQLRLPFVRLSKVPILGETLGRVPAETAEKYRLIPIQEEGRTLVVAMADPLTRYAVEDLAFITGMSIRVVVAPQEDIQLAIEKFYSKRGPVLDLGFDLLEPEPMEIIQRREADEVEVKDIQNLAGLPPVVRLANAILANAIHLRASDVHIEPSKGAVLIRCRVDGILQDLMKLDKGVHAALVSRIKIISSMDISIQRKPQDGKAQIKYEERYYDLRVSTIPTFYGEKATIRILNPAMANMLPEDLGLIEGDLKALHEAIALPQGILLVTGPTGSGKSSTLYACLNKVNTPLVNIVTVEDPVEFDIAGINQVQINPKAGITFAAGLRSILRQDPDVVMVGEIRDSETAAIAFQAAQTGHLVLSTLHTNDAPSAITRLLDLGIEDYLICSALVVVLAQRLVRKICPSCKVEDHIPPHLMEKILPYLQGQEHPTFFKGAGCETCKGGGYSGRLGVFELLRMTPAIKDRISRGVSANALLDIARQEGFRTMAEDSIAKALKGLTTIEEIFRVVPPEVFRDERVSGKPETSSTTLEPPFLEQPLEQGPPIERPEESPLVQPAGPDPGSVPLPPSKKGTGILIVDDNVVVLQALGKALVSFHQPILTATNGLEALEKIKQQKPALIITDYNMPEMDGYAFIQTLKSREDTRNIPIIMLTGREDEDAEVRVLAAGADDYLTKPVNPKKLLARVTRFVSRQQIIVVAEDNRFTRDLMVKIFRHEPYQVLAAENGKAALDLVLAHRPDLVITDYMMPEMDGLALISEMKSRTETREIPVIVLTAKEDVESEVKALEAGAEDYITKPVQAQRLLARSKRLLERHEKQAGVA